MHSKHILGAFMSKPTNILATSNTLYFSLDRNPVSAEEQERFDADLRSFGIDRCYWAAMNGLISTRSPNVRPIALRLHRGGRVVGLAHLTECRRNAHTLVPGFLGRLGNLLPTPMFCWNRGDPGVDLLGSPGFVAEGEARDDFYRAAISFLCRRYRFGVVMEGAKEPPGGPCVSVPHADWGYYDARGEHALEAIFADRKNLRRKVSKFKNKGGCIEIVERALCLEDRKAVSNCLATTTANALSLAPFQENYPNLVRWTAESGAPGILHILARFGGRVAGYHTFLQSGKFLICLSGAFDRNLSSAYHAYENILLEAMGLAERRGLAGICFGPVLNLSKASLMGRFERFELRFYSRSGLTRRALTMILPRTLLNPDRISDYIGIEAKRATPPTFAG